MKRLLSDDEIKDLYVNHGLSHSEIARRCGVSRERIRQLLVSNFSLPPGREMLAIKRQAKDDEKERLRLEREAKRAEAKENSAELLKKKYRHLQDLWMSGKSIKAIATEVNIPKSSLAWIIGDMRTRFGWFDKRRPSYKRTT